MVAWPTDALCHETRSEQRLSKIGPAPEFTLTNQDGKRIALKDLRGKVLAITFIFASCTDTCPLLTATMAGLQDRLGADFRSTRLFRLDHRGSGARHAGGSEALCRSASGESRRLGFPDRHAGGDPRGGQAIWDLLQEDAAWRRGPHFSYFPRRPERNTARPVHGGSIRSGGDAPRPAESFRDGKSAMTRWLTEWLPPPRRAGAGDHTHRSCSRPFCPSSSLLIMVGAVGLQVLSGVNHHAEELVTLQRKIAAYRQLQHDTTAQLYSVASALLVPDEPDARGDPAATQSVRLRLRPAAVRGEG